MEMIYGAWGIFALYNIINLDNPLGGYLSLGLAGGCYLLVKKMRIVTRFVESKSSIFKKHSENSIIFQSVKSNHNLICPKLDFMDNKIVEFNKEIEQINKIPNEKLTTKVEKPSKLQDHKLKST